MNCKEFQGSVHPHVDGELPVAAMAAADAHAPECRDEHSHVAPHCRAPSRKTGCWGASRANSANGAFGATLKNRRVIGVSPRYCLNIGAASRAPTSSTRTVSL